VLTKLRIRNFKRFEDVTIDLGNVVVFIGPNNSGKTSALQALALWELGLRKWTEKRSGKPTPEKRPGVTINRRDLIAIPVPDANLLWRELHVRDVQRADGGKTRTENVRIEVVVDGVTEGTPWQCGLEFDYANAESLYCRPRREGAGSERMVVPDLAHRTRVSYLPPMSGLAATEERLEPGAIAVRIGEGRTAEVLRNLCHRVAGEAGEGGEAWQRLNARVRGLFGVELEAPRYLPESGQITMSYRERGGTTSLDLASAGRGLHQTVLLLAHMTVNPGSVLLLDEPDAHLEILRQRQTYQLLSDVARETGSQIVAASHSEVVLNEAADRDVVLAFVGRPHRIDGRGSQVLKALRQIGYEHYYLAESKGWVLYLEGATDLAVLRAFAGTLRHPAAEHLEAPFVHYVGNQPALAREH
jgi:hypothetical protein